MRFVDQVRVLVEAGDGGDGAVAWRRESNVPRGGPAGGDGGRGGDVTFVADHHLSTLLDLKSRRHLRAEAGRPGGGHDRNGRSGQGLEIRVPVGTLVFVDGAAEQSQEDEPSDGDEMETIYVGPDEPVTGEPGMTISERAALRAAGFETPVETARELPPPGTLLGDLSESGQRFVVAQGGKGGRGNIHFRSSTNRAPDFAEPGTPGESMWLRLELKLLADVGLVGFPNVGKSTLIAATSRARPQIANYPFTTLVPQLGVVKLGEGRSMVVADVPGLIEGASEGKGLGHRFLRHLERTRVLVHLIAPDPDPQRDLLQDLEVIEAELGRYGPAFEGRPRLVALNKIDTLQDDEGQQRLDEFRSALRARNIPLFPISAVTREGITPLLEAIWRRLEAVRSREP